MPALIENLDGLRDLSAGMSSVAAGVSEPIRRLLIDNG
ncbi:hypothetical protein FOPG_08985 [Fusarium oxysporum f. sp. conglutinans race 2 54008]|uniref:Uncharacterized protein n=2 Tax=Fusarium oxysporum TaxID=5507 RepID=X0LCQ4_FUSOX|nr:hypothetical protein FOPG_08985 [Fusarium oxysporum f. sp. conglutinans race 2 54008]EXM23593.1 hypothetical protein FOTG_09046 [Fusarium oxysporum f. sp. vasinfectum 25433]